MMTFQDFPPRLLEPKRLFRDAVYGEVRDTVRTADAWMKEHGIRPLNVETLVLPVAFPAESTNAGSTASSVDTGHLITWLQVVRVWYESK
jgi:uncharacterized protein (UPF0210 family)